MEKKPRLPIEPTGSSLSAAQCWVFFYSLACSSAIKIKTQNNIPLLYIILSFFIIKGLLAWPFYYKLGFKPLLVGFLLALAEAPFLTLLYHDTDIDFWLVFFLLIVFDMAVYLLLLQKVWWKAIVAAILFNFLGFILFILVNG